MSLVEASIGHLNSRAGPQPAYREAGVPFRPRVLIIGRVSEESSTRLDLHWVSPQIAVGGRVPPEAVAELVRGSIRHVVDLRCEDCDDEAALRRHGIALLRLPTADGRAPAQAMLREGVEWVRQRLARDEKVLIHCEYGIGRGPLLTSCVLISAGLEPLQALTRIKDARAQASPSPEQLAALVEWAAAWREKNRLAWSIPTVDALGCIAYRHLASY